MIYPLKREIFQSYRGLPEGLTSPRSLGWPQLLPYAPWCWKIYLHFMADFEDVHLHHKEHLHNKVTPHLEFAVTAVVQAPSVPQNHGDQGAGGDGRQVGKELRRAEDQPGGRVAPVLGRRAGDQVLDGLRQYVSYIYIYIHTNIYIYIYRSIDRSIDLCIYLSHPIQSNPIQSNLI